MDMSWQASLSKAVRDLRREEQRLVRELGALRRKIGSLSGVTAGKARKSTAKRNLSPAGRAAISRAAKKRWAAWRRSKEKARPE
jgi:hypothetical protein